MQKTLLSVILPVYNGMPFLSEALDSLLNQSFQDFKILVIDNGSIDETSNFINELKNEKIKYFKLDKKDLIKALNKGVELANTELIARMDSDDISHPSRFEKQLNFLSKNREIDVVGTNGYYISKNDNKKIKINLPLYHDNIVNAMLDKKSAIIHPSIMLRSTVFKKYGSYDASFFPCEDYELFLRIGNRIKFANINEHLYSLRVRENSIMSNQIKESIKLYYLINRNYADNYLNSPNTYLESDQKLRLNERLDVISVSIYRQGLNYFLNVNALLGVFFFIIASVLNPSRLFHSIQRKISWSTVKDSSLKLL